MLARFVLGFLLTLPVSVPALVAALEAEQQSTLTIRMWASVGGVLQVYFDTGTGFNEPQSVRLALRPSAEAVDYHIPLMPGVYEALRIDPGVSAGRYIIDRMTIGTDAGEAIATIPLNEVRAAYHLIEDTRTAARLIVDAPPGSFDPQLLYEPATPMPVLPSVPPLGRQLAIVGAYLAVGLLFVYCAELASHRMAPATVRAFRGLGRWATANPSAAVLVVASLATFIATYPVLLFDRSFVTPNNGGTLMLYDQPPYVPAGADFAIEDVRGSDVGAMMWAFVPYSKVQREALERGEFPLWNRYNASGRTFWAQGQTFLFDPLHWLTLIAPDPAPGWDLKFVAHRLVFAWGVGVAALVATGAWMPASIAALSAPFISVFAYRFNHPASFAVTYIPWVLFGWFLLAHSGDRRAAARSALLLALASSLALVSSPPKEAALLLVAAQATGLLGVLLQGDPLSVLGWRLLFASGAGIAFLLLTTPHWLMFLDALREAQTASDEPTVILASRPYALGFVLGTLMPGMAFPGAHLLLVTLAGAILVRPLAFLRNRLLLACALVAALLLAMAFGIVPVEWMMRVPLLSRIQHVYDIALLGAVVLVLIAGAAGTVSLLSAPRWRIWLATSMIAAACMWLVSRVISGTSIYRFEPWAGMAVALLATSLPLLVLSWRRAPARVLPAAATASALLGVLLPGGLHLETGWTPLDRLIMQPRARVNLEPDSPAVDAIHKAASEPGRVVGLNLVLFSGSQALYQVEGIGGPDALEIPEYEALVDAAGIERRWIWLTMVSNADLERLSPLLDLLNVRFLLARADGLPSGYSIKPNVEPDLLRALDRPSAWPRAFFVDSVSTYADPADLLRQIASRGRPMAAVQDTDDTAIAATRGLSSIGSPPGAADRYTVGTNTTAFRVRAPGPGVAVLGEAYLDDDFVATLNGQEIPYFRVNHAFKAVRIPAAGDWEVQFEYRPARWSAAWMAAALGGLACLLLATAALWPARKAVSTTLPAISPTEWNTFDTPS